jgi:hypothetical protein
MKAESMSITEIIDELVRIREMYGESTEVAIEDDDAALNVVYDMSLIEVGKHNVVLLCVN